MTKLHLSHPTDPTKPFCGRQVFNHRQRVSQDQEGIVLAGTREFAVEVNSPKGKFCRFCARTAGYLPPLVHRTRDSEDLSEDAEAEMVERELGEEDTGEEIES